MDALEKQVKGFPKIIDFAHPFRGQVGNPLFLVGIADRYLSYCLLSPPKRSFFSGGAAVTKIEF
ncbi:MAG: hypothetical protein K5753_06960 [Clostridia bacterium]|nr:hypothetical protein [Clostridia bacterium]